MISVRKYFALSVKVSKLDERKLSIKIGNGVSIGNAEDWSCSMSMKNSSSDFERCTLNNFLVPFVPFQRL